MVKISLLLSFLSSSYHHYHHSDSLWRGDLETFSSATACIYGTELQKSHDVAENRDSAPTVTSYPAFSPSIGVQQLWRILVSSCLGSRPGEAETIPGASHLYNWRVLQIKLIIKLDINKINTKLCEKHCTCSTDKRTIPGLTLTWMEIISVHSLSLYNLSGLISLVLDLCWTAALSSRRL